MKKEIETNEMIKRLGNDKLVRGILANCYQEQTMYEGNKREGFDKEISFQSAINRQMMQSIDNVYNLLDDGDRRVFLQLIREGKLKSLSTETMEQYSWDFFPTDLDDKEELGSV